MNLLVRTAMPPRNITSAVRAQVAAVDPGQPVADVQTVDQLVDSSLAQPRFIMLLLGLFSITALALAVIGIYGVLSYWVAQRRYELGIRLALGAQRADILRLVVRQGFTLAGAGIVIGLIAALLLTPLMSSMLYKAGSLDVATFALTPLVFLAIAMLATYLPARSATRVDAAESLRGN
jgi:ABC-type antimicrobial peptide transport system permease subunit